MEGQQNNTSKFLLDDGKPIAELTPETAVRYAQGVCDIIGGLIATLAHNKMLDIEALREDLVERATLFGPGRKNEPVRAAVIAEMARRVEGMIAVSREAPAHHVAEDAVTTLRH